MTYVNACNVASYFSRHSEYFWFVNLLPNDCYDVSTDADVSMAAFFKGCAFKC